MCLRQVLSYVLMKSKQSYPRVGDTVRISFNVSAMKKIRCEAIVVRITEARGHYPRGMGIKFVDMDRIHEKKFSEFLSN
jgi:c-di-GMP-binding flagellar brake protein YcgR